MSTTEYVNFSIEGEFLTDFFRGRCLEGEWTRALNELRENLSYMDPETNERVYFPMDMAVSVLSGTHKLVGVNELSLEIDNDSEEYQTNLMYSFKNLIYVHGSWFEPMAIINTISKDSEDAYDRARIYCPDYDNGMFFNDNFIALKTTDKRPPMWLEEKLRKEPQPENFLSNVITYGVTDESLYDLSMTETDMLHSIIQLQSERGFICSEDEILDFMEEDFVQTELSARISMRSEILERRRVNYYADLRTKIIAQAEKNGGFMIIKSRREGKEFKVPKAPFQEWCYKHGSHKLYMSEFLTDWDPVSPSGIKMGGDDPYHTDYVIGAGYDPRDFYDNDSFKSAAFSALHRALQLDMITISGSGVVEGSVMKVTPDTPVADCKDQIIVIPHAGVEYFEQSKVAALTIAEEGGPGSHLAVNATEFDIKLALIEEALKLHVRDKFSFDLDNNTFKEIDKSTYFDEDED